MSSGATGAGRLAPRRVGTPGGWNKPTHRERQPKPKKSRGANGCFPFQHSHGKITPWTLPPGALLLFLRRAQRPRSAARARGTRKMNQDVDAGRLERRVRRVGKKTMPGFHGFCSFYPFGAIRGVPLFATRYPKDSWTSQNVSDGVTNPVALRLFCYLDKQDFEESFPKITRIAPSKRSSISSGFLRSIKYNDASFPTFTQ